MDSVAKAVRICKRARVERAAHAVIVNPSADYVVTVNSDNLRSNSGADGKIKGLSVKSLARLRSAIARTAHTGGKYRVYGVCMTIPWGSNNPNDPRNPSQDLAGMVWRGWVHHLGRLLDELQCGIIYRVELQARKTTHWHMMVYFPESLDAQTLVNKVVSLVQSCDTSWNILCTSRKRGGRPMIDCGGSMDRVSLAHNMALRILRHSWIVALSKVHSSLIGEYERERWAATFGTPAAPGVVAPAPLEPYPIKTFDFCFDAIPLDGVKSGVAYLASHTTKHKQDQLGYTGKQWGYLGRKWLFQPPPLVLAGGGVVGVDDYAVRIRAFRLIRAWLRRNRASTDWRVARPRRLRVGDSEVFKGLVVRNLSALYLFGLPDSVILPAFDCARLCFPVRAFLKREGVRYALA